MHEFITAQSIIKRVKRIIKEHNIKKIHRIEISVGELTFLEPEQFSFWIKEGLNEIAGRVEVEIEVIPLKIRCESCGYTGSIETKDDPTFLRALPIFACPNCQDFKIEVIAGKECHLKTMEVD